MNARQRKLSIVAVVVTTLGLAAFNLDTLLFASAVAASEKRQSLLSDARWGKPESARDFNSRFKRGTPEEALVSWLAANDFTLDATAKTASRKVGGFPCAENIEVTWTTQAPGMLRSAEALVTEAGCL